MKKLFVLSALALFFGCGGCDESVPKIALDTDRSDVGSTDTTQMTDTPSDAKEDVTTDIGADFVVQDVAADVEPETGAVCGNDILEEGETCDPIQTCPTDCEDNDECTVDSRSGSRETCDVVCVNEAITVCTNDDGCCAPGCNANNDNDCQPFCGNSEVEAPEICDGNCPDLCDDQDACTENILQGSAATCDAVCTYPDITVCDLVNADGCCPSNCDANTDADCNPICGNNVIEGNEVCDGNCPTACDDNVACTDNVLVGSAANCDAMCTYPAITTCDLQASDNCCPANCNNVTDVDCQSVCGNNVIEQGETCDPSNTCPTTCDDMDACTTDAMSGSPATCNVACSNVDITACSMVSDGCCPSNCNDTNDADCNAVCGNGIIETGETCDPMATCPTACDDMDACTTDVLSGSAADCDAACNYSAITACVDNDGCCPAACDASNDSDCIAVPTAYRISTISLRDPHAFALIAGFFCIDITSNLNAELNSANTSDDDADGFLDLSLLAVQRPSDPSSATPLPMDISEGTCTAPASTTSCDQALPVSVTTYSNSLVAGCTAPVAGTTTGYSPAVGQPSAPCFEGAPTSLTLDLGGILVPLTDVQFGATWNGNPVTSLTNGLLYGFISEADADQIIIPMSVPQVGGQTLSSLFPGGTGNCAPGDDTDLGSDNVTTGWWIYLNFTADPVPYTGT